MVHPYIPNSVPSIKEAMLQAVEASSADEFYEDVPAELRLGESMSLPESLMSEYELKRHIAGLLAKNKTTTKMTMIPPSRSASIVLSTDASMKAAWRNRFLLTTIPSGREA